MEGNFYATQSADAGYFADRRLKPYRSTLALEGFVREHGFFSGLSEGSLVADMACGTGSETAYLAEQHPSLNFVGVDLEERFISAATRRHADLRNLSFTQGDIYALDHETWWQQVQSVWCSQTLSWLPWWRTELRSLIGPSVDRIALSTLAWDGPIESEVVHFLGPRGDPATKSVHYNVYSIPEIINFMQELGFKRHAIKKFEIDIDLPPPARPGLGSHTVETVNGQRLTFSAWQYMPWHFLLFNR